VIARSQDHIDYECSFTIISYSMASKLTALIEKMRYSVMIADEAHYLKSQSTNRSKNLVPMMAKVKRILLLTGTPMLGRPNELYNLVKILRPDVFSKFVDYGVRYCAPRECPYGIDWSGSANRRELHLMLEKSLMIRRLKSEVLMELPAKRRQKVIVPIDPSMAQKIRTLLSSIKRFESKLEDDFAQIQQALE